MGASVQSTTGSRGVRLSGSNGEYTMFRDSVKSTGYPLHSPVSLSLPLPCVTVCHHISTGVYTRLGVFLYLKTEAQPTSETQYFIKKLLDGQSPNAGSSVGKATGYGLDGPRIESRWGRDFPHLSRSALVPTQPLVQWVPGLSRG